MKIGLRSGHSPNCKGAMKLRDEQECMRALYYHVEKLLKQYGHTVIDCNSNANSAKRELSEGANKANSNNVDYFISLHMNASNGKGHGTEAWTYSRDSRANNIAKRLVNNYEKLGYSNRGVKFDYDDGDLDYYEMRNIKAPNIIFETLFCDNKNDVEIWAKTSWEDHSHAIANAIDSGIPLYHPSSEPTSSNNSNNDTKLRVVVGTYKDKLNATSMQNKLKDKGFDTFLVAYNDMYRVIAGTYSERNNAINMQNKLKNSGFESFLIVYNG